MRRYRVLLKRLPLYFLRRNRRLNCGFVRNLKVPSFKITRSSAREGGRAIQYCHRSGFPAAVRCEVLRYAEGVEKERGAAVCLGQIGSGCLGPGLSVKGEASRGCERSFVMRPVCFDRPWGGGRG